MKGLDSFHLQMINCRAVIWDGLLTINWNGFDCCKRFYHPRIEYQAVQMSPFVYGALHGFLTRLRVNSMRCF